MSTIRLRNVFLHVTKACNLQCRYCYFSASRPLPDELAADELERVWPDLVALQPEKLIFTGGEPLLRADIFELLRGFRAANTGRRVTTCLNSNGHLVTHACARKLVGLVDEVRVSIDGLQETNDRLRGEGNFRAALAALRTYHEVGFEPKALVTVTSSSLPELPKLVALLIERGIARINLNPFRPIGRGRGHPEWSVDPDDVERTLANAGLSLSGSLAVEALEERRGRSNCGVGSFLNIMSNGDVFPCHVLTEREFRGGNLREQSLLEICDSAGLLGRLHRLEFPDVAKRHPSLALLTQPRACMGDVYAATKEKPEWDAVLGRARDA